MTSHSRHFSFSHCLAGCFLFLFLLASPNLAGAQEHDSITYKASLERDRLARQRDAYDVLLKMFKTKAFARTDTMAKRPGKLYISAIPGAGYTLITGFAGLIVANGAFYTSAEESANISSILSEPAYTQYKQILLPIQTNIWTKGNRYNIQTDWSYKKFPQDTYGLGARNSLSDAFRIDYSHLRFYQTVFRSIWKDLFAGIGYYNDYFYNIKEVGITPGKITDFQKYGFSQRSSSSGFTLNLLYDLRRNLINPLPGGWYANIVYRNNQRSLGSDANWTSLLVDVRKYYRFPANSKSILGFWTYNVFTLSGKPPYLALPYTGGDTYINSGRGYVQGRFRGQNMAYVEAEWRFGILRNGFLGGVIFANVQSYTETLTRRFELLRPAAGAGLRFKLNKFSNTNVAIDYGFGAGGSQGIFVNLGEVF